MSPGDPPFEEEHQGRSWRGKGRGKGTGQKGGSFDRPKSDQGKEGQTGNGALRL
jgi:hypothetical protein